MTKNLIPDLIVRSVYEITPILLENSGIKGVLVDLDYTLADRLTKEPEDAIIDWVKSLCEHNIKVSIISNNHQKRVDIFNKKLGLLNNIGGARKPFRKAFLNIATKMNLSPEKIAVVGDQIFTDVLGGNRVGMFTILVNATRKNTSFLYLLRHLLETPFIRKYESLRIRDK